MLTRLTLKGNFIWTADAVQNPGKPVVYLDGDTFGIPGADFLDVRLPSGDGQVGGDFEMWSGWCRDSPRSNFTRCG